MLIDQEVNVSKDIVRHLTDPEFWDAKIVGIGGEIPVNKTILSMRSLYFRSMFSESNNFKESQAGSVKMPYPKAVLDKMVSYLYSGQLDCEEMSLRALMDLLEMFNMMNLPAEYGNVETFTLDNIKSGMFALSDCLKYLEDSSKLGLKTVGETLLSHLGSKFGKIQGLQEVGLLSEVMILRLLEERSEKRSQTILRFKTFAKWFSLNSMEDVAKVLDLFNFEDFTFKELKSDVRKSGLYPVERIMDRMEELYETKEELELRVTPGYVRKCDKWFDEQQDTFGHVFVEDVRIFLKEVFDEDLPDSILEEILELSDPDDDGSLNRSMFHVVSQLALKSAFQGAEVPDQFPHYSPPEGNFRITPNDKRLYDSWFDGLGPQDGRLSQKEVVGVFQDWGFELSKFAFEWIRGLSELGQLGSRYFDRIGFSIFSHLAVRAYFYGYSIPMQLPPQLSRENLSKL